MLWKIFTDWMLAGQTKLSGKDIKISCCVIKCLQDLTPNPSPKAEGDLTPANAWLFYLMQTKVIKLSIVPFYILLKCTSYIKN